MGAFESMAAAVRAPKETFTDSIPSTAVNTDGFDLYSVGIQTGSEAYVTIRSSVACTVRFGSAVPTAGVQAGANDWPISANTPEPFLIDASTRYLSVFGSGGPGTLYVYKSS